MPFEAELKQTIYTNLEIIEHSSGNLQIRNETGEDAEYDFAICIDRKLVPELIKILLDFISK